METLFKNHFDTVKISYDNLKKFSEDHLARITANNPGGVFNDLVTKTGIAHTAYFGAITNKDVATAVKQGMTLAVDNQIAAFKALVRRKESAVANAFGDDSPQYQEFFPHGMTEYSNAIKANIETLMSRIATAGDTYKNELGEEFGQAFSDSYRAYQSLREAQLGKKGSVSDLQDVTGKNRTVLELQLTANLHYIAFTYPGEVQQCLSYFDQSFLRDTKENKEEE